MLLHQSIINIPNCDQIRMTTQSDALINSTITWAIITSDEHYRYIAVDSLNNYVLSLSLFFRTSALAQFNTFFTSPLYSSIWQTNDYPRHMRCSWVLRSVDWRKQCCWWWDFKRASFEQFPFHCFWSQADTNWRLLIGFILPLTLGQISLGFDGFSTFCSKIPAQCRFEDWTENKVGIEFAIL